MVHSLRRPIYSLVLEIALAVTALFVGMREVQAEKSTDHLHADGHEYTPAA
jgi:hypothetical protein